MELLEEYQIALTKIQTLEKQLKECKEVIERSELGLKSVCESLDRAEKMLVPELSSASPQETVMADVLFTTPRCMLSLLAKMLRLPFMDGEEKEEAKRKIAESTHELLMRKLDRLRAMVED